MITFKKAPKYRASVCYLCPCCNDETEVGMYGYEKWVVPPIKRCACKQEMLRFDSKKERARYLMLRILESRNAIQDLKRQVPFYFEQIITAPQMPDGKRILKTVRYIADFTYELKGEFIVEDCKGFKTAEYKRKKKWMKMLYGIEILES